MLLHLIGNNLSFVLNFVDVYPHRHSSSVEISGCHNIDTVDTQTVKA